MVGESKSRAEAERATAAGEVVGYEYPKRGADKSYRLINKRGAWGERGSRKKQRQQPAAGVEMPWEAEARFTTA